MERPENVMQQKLFSSKSSSSRNNVPQPPSPNIVTPPSSSPSIFMEDSSGFVGMISNNMTYLIIGLVAVCFGICVFLYREVKNLKIEIEDCVKNVQKVGEIEKIVSGFEKKLNHLLQAPRVQMPSRLPPGAAAQLIRQQQQQQQQSNPKPKEEMMKKGNDETKCEDGVCEIPDLTTKHQTQQPTKKVIDL